MILRTLGLCLLALCFPTGGLLLAKRQKNAAKDPDTLCSLLEHMQREIVYRRSKRDDCMRSFFELHPHPSRDDFIAGDYASALERFTLRKDVRERLLDFFSGFGRADAREEEERIDETLRFLRDFAASEKKVEPQKRKVYVTLGICMAAVLLLLFL